MSQFNGFSKVEIEMLLDEMAKTLPALIAIAPSFAQLVRAHYDALKKQDFSERDAMILAVQSAGKQLGFN